MDHLFQRRLAGLPRAALVVEGKSVNREGILAIRMLPAEQYGEALVGVGERVAISWADLERAGLEAFRAVWSVAPDAPPNVDFARGKASLRLHKTLLLEVDEGQVVLSPQGTWTDKRGARDADRTRLALPVSNQEFVAAVRDALVRK